MLTTSQRLIGLVVFISICSIASGTLTYVPASSQSQCRQCSARELQAGRANRFGRTFLDQCCNTGPTCKCGVAASMPGDGMPGASYGYRNKDDQGDRIVGGVETGINEYPWMAGLVETRESTDIVCGAILVASQFVVTAAHCVGPPSLPAVLLPGEVFVVLGEHDTASPADTNLRKVVGVSKVIVSPIWNPLSRIGDLAVLKLEEAVDLEVYTPICLPAFTDTWMDGQDGLVTGWGAAIESGNFVTPTKLQEVEAPIQTRDTCEAAFTAVGAPPGLISTGMVCAGITGMQPCFGDSGGPLTTREENQHKLVGAVSFGVCSNNPSQPGPVPGVFTDVAVYRRWLDETFSEEGGATFCNSD